MYPGQMSAQSQLHSGWFTTSDGVRIHYLEGGSGPLMVFVPGGLIPAEIWEPQLRYFVATHRVVAMDPRSQGRSDKPTDGHYLSRRGQDIGELISHLDDGPAVVVVWSLGVPELLTYLRESGTGSIRAAVLVDMYLGLDSKIGEPHPFEPAWRPRLVGLQKDRENWTREFVDDLFGSEQAEEYLAAIRRGVSAVPTNTAVTLLANLMLIEDRDFRPTFDALDVPVLYVVREALSAFVEEARQRRPKTRVAVFEDVEHALFADQPERFNELVEEFLASSARS
jgi:non-heme chloroperoxidase